MLLLSACARVEIKDAEVCGDLGPHGAECFHTLSNKERSLNKEEWDAARFGMLCTSAESFTNWKTAIMQLCEQSQKCTFEDLRALEEFEAKLHNLIKEQNVSLNRLREELYR
jgi:hypothetical protein